MIARIVAWLTAHIQLGGKTGATNGGYWGGITMWDRAKALLTRRRD